MRPVHRLLIVLALLAPHLVRADEPPRRTSRVASGPVRPARDTAPPPEAPRTPPSPKPTVAPPVTRPATDRSTLLEPTLLREGVGRGMVACFQVAADRAELWQLVVREVGGPLAQIYEGEGPPPATIPWDGRLLDGGLAWSGIAYTYDFAWVDSSGTVGEVAGADFTLPAYSREERLGLSFLMPGKRLWSGRHGDPVAAAAAGLRSVAERLNQDSGLATVRIEVLAPDERTALALGESVRAALAGLLDPGGRPVDLYVGTASAAPPEGTVLVTTVPLTEPAS